MSRRVYLDSNVILRLFLADIPAQKLRAEALFAKIEKGEVAGYLSVLVLNEIIWISEHFYRAERDNYVPRLIKMLSLKNIKAVEMKKHVLVELLEKFQMGKVDFTDIYLTSIAEGKGKIASFDKDLVKLKAKLVDF